MNYKFKIVLIIKLLMALFGQVNVSLFLDSYKKFLLTRMTLSHSIPLFLNPLPPFNPSILSPFHSLRQTTQTCVVTYSAIPPTRTQQHFELGSESWFPSRSSAPLLLTPWDPRNYLARSKACSGYTFGYILICLVSYEASSLIYGNYYSSLR